MVHPAYYIYPTEALVDDKDARIRELETMVGVLTSDSASTSQRLARHEVAFARAMQEMQELLDK